MNYKIKLEIFEGPLDLLLYLVKKDHLNIYDIPIAKVTEQYMRYIELMQSLDLNIAGEFLVMAATLMEIKSKMLLPAQEEAEVLPEEDPRQELVRQLLEYEKFKQIAEELREKEAEQRHIFKRPKSEEKEALEKKDEKEEEKPVYFEASIFDLISAFSRALEEAPKELFYQVIKDEYTVEEKVHDILHLLLIKPSVKLSDLFKQARHKLEIIVTFLAVLELIKLKEIIAQQKEAFGDIEVVRNQAHIIPYDRRAKEEDKQEDQP